jgi:hypothetical protein
MPILPLQSRVQIVDTTRATPWLSRRKSLPSIATPAPLLAPVPPVSLLPRAPPTRALDVISSTSSEVAHRHDGAASPLVQGSPDPSLASSTLSMYPPTPSTTWAHEFIPRAYTPKPPISSSPGAETPSPARRKRSGTDTVLLLTARQRNASRLGVDRVIPPLQPASGAAQLSEALDEIFDVRRASVNGRLGFGPPPDGAMAGRMSRLSPGPSVVWLVAPRGGSPGEGPPPYERGGELPAYEPGDRCIERLLFMFGFCGSFTSLEQAFGTNGRVATVLPPLWLAGALTLLLRRRDPGAVGWAVKSRLERDMRMARRRRDERRWGKWCLAAWAILCLCVGIGAGVGLGVMKVLRNGS